MIRLLIFIAVGICLLGLAQFTGNLNGTIEISANGLTSDYKMGVVTFILYIIGICLAIVASLCIVFWLFGLKGRFARIKKNSAKDKAGILLEQGMMAMGRGDYLYAEKKLLQGVKFTDKNSHVTSFYWSAAAMAANQQGKGKKRDEYLLKARESELDGEDTFDSKLTEARLFLDVNKPNRALVALKSDSSRFLHPQVLRMKLEAYVLQEDYESAWKLLPNIKGKVLKGDDFFAKQAEVATGLFKVAKADKSVLRDVWHALPDGTKFSENTVINYATAMITTKDFVEAEEALAEAVKASNYSDVLIQAYTQLSDASSTKMLHRAEDWINLCKESAWLYYAGAKFAFRSEMLDKAEHLASESLKHGILPECYALLGEILKTKGEDSRALEAFRTSASLTFFQDDTSKAGDVLSADDASPKLEDSSQVF